MTMLETSVLIGYLRTKDAALWSLIQSQAPVICGLTRAEVLAGARNPADRARLLITLNSFGQLTFVEGWWENIGDNAALLRSKGVVVPMSDIVIASIAIAANHDLWTRDRHFIQMQVIFK